MKFQIYRPEVRRHCDLLRQIERLAFGNASESHLTTLLAKAQSQHPKTVRCTSNLAEEVYNHGLVKHP